MKDAEEHHRPGCSLLLLLRPLLDAMPGWCPGWLQEARAGVAGTASVPILVTRRLPPQPHMPLLSIYSLALEQDLEFGHGMVQAVGTLQTQTFMQVSWARGEVGWAGMSPAGSALTVVPVSLSP